MKKIYKSKFKAGFISVGVVFLAAPTMAQVLQQAIQTSFITFGTAVVETGPVLDVVPYVLSDGYTINLTLIPNDTEFVQYQTPPTIPTVTGNQNVVTEPIVLPEFSVKEVVTTVNVWDHQTVVLGGLISSQVTTSKDKVPVLGDLPLFGTLFQSQSKSTIRKNLMIFVTTTIVDPAGNMVHSDDELPFAQNSIPVQAPENRTISEKVETVHAMPNASND